MSRRKSRVIMGLPARFWAKAVIEDRGFETPCLTWIGAKSTPGYAVLRVGGRTEGFHFGHRLAYEAAKGPIPEGLVIDHLCRNRACVNAEHLEAVTNRENILRGETIMAANAAKTHCSNGHPFDAENTYLRTGKGYVHRRVCRTCERDRRRARTIANRERRAREREQSNAAPSTEKSEPAQCWNTGRAQ